MSAIEQPTSQRPALANGASITKGRASARINNGGGNEVLNPNAPPVA